MRVTDLPFLLIATISIPTWLAVCSLLSAALMLLLLLAGLFAPGLRYRVSEKDKQSNESEAFLFYMEALTDAKVNRESAFEVLTNGPSFYEAELAAIAGARSNVDLEAYIFDRGDIGQRFLSALAERARAGCAVNVLLDAFGSFGVNARYFAPLLEAGGKVTWYNSPAWYRLFHLSNRTHRELLIVDGRIGFIGGAGIADQWYKGADGKPRWRDTVVRVEGDAVPSLQATFAENWLQGCGELISGSGYFPAERRRSDELALVVNSTPTVGGSTRARILFQLMVASAKSSIDITTPYFLPDSNLTEELVRAVQERHVRVRIVVPNKRTDHLLTRSASRRGYGALLRAGAELYEYRPAMIHAKVLLIDGLWSVVGSTNFDPRSFGINDEVNMAVRGRETAERLARDFEVDVAESRKLSYDEWVHRPVLERVPELLGWLIERQQ